jgi:hypothetical protein
VRVAVVMAVAGVLVLIGGLLDNGGPGGVGLQPRTVVPNRCPGTGSKFLESMHQRTRFTTNCCTLYGLFVLVFH